MVPGQSLVELLGRAGFEAMLKDEVRGRDGRCHDIAILSLDLARAARRQDAYGADET